MNDIFHAKGAGGAGSELSRALIAARLQGGVMVVDRNLRVVMIDRKAADFCQVSSGQSQGKRFYALFPGLLGSGFSGELHQIISAERQKSFYAASGQQSARSICRGFLSRQFFAVGCVYDSLRRWF